MVGDKDRLRSWSSRTAQRLDGRRVHVLGVSALIMAVGIAGCTGGVATAPDRSTASAAVTPAAVAPAAVAPAAVAQASFIEVRRAPGCGCCTGWEAYMREQGFTVEGYEDPDIVQFKDTSGVPLSAQACHTAIVDGYIVEGHVPIEAINDLLEQRPAIDGIALAGMPMGSPGMGGEKQGPFEVQAFSDGEATPFGAY